MRLDLERLLRTIRSRIDLCFQQIKASEGRDTITLSIIATELEDLFKGGCDVAEKFFKGCVKADWLPYSIGDDGRVRRLHLPIYGGER